MDKNKNPSEKSGGGYLKLLLFLGVGAWFLWPALKSALRPGPAGQPPPQTPPSKTAPPQSIAAPMKFDWPRGEGAEGKVELAADLATRNYYIVLDGSGSMADRNCAGGATKMEAAKQALGEFAKSVPASAQLGLMAFDERGVSERVPLGLGNRDRFLVEVRAVSANGGTPLKSAIALGLSKLEDAARRQLGYGEYNLVIVTDGEANPEGEDPRRIVDDILARSPVTIHTIGFCIGKDHSLNQPGRTVYRTADNLAELRSGLGSVLAEAETYDVAGFAAPKRVAPHH